MDWANTNYEEDRSCHLLLSLIVRLFMSTKRSLILPKKNQNFQTMRMVRESTNVVIGMSLVTLQTPDLDLWITFTVLGVMVADFFLIDTSELTRILFNSYLHYISCSVNTMVPIVNPVSLQVILSLLITFLEVHSQMLQQVEVTYEMHSICKALPSANLLLYLPIGPLILFRPRLSAIISDTSRDRQTEHGAHVILISPRDVQSHTKVESTPSAHPRFWMDLHLLDLRDMSRRKDGGWKIALGRSDGPAEGIH